jgi:hypothetical protein
MNGYELAFAQTDAALKGLQRGFLPHTLQGSVYCRSSGLE